MKSMLFGLALLCALPGCCGWWRCKDKCKEDVCVKPSKREMKEDRKNGKMMDKKDYKK